MNVVYHPAVQRDVSAILRYYDRVSVDLGDGFWKELTAAIQEARTHPERHHFTVGALRRINLQRFPYHALYRLSAAGVRVVVVRHHRRTPSFGIGRR